MELQIKEILSRETYPLRHPYLREGQPLESCVLEKDEDPQTLHLGAFFNSKLIGIISAMPNPCPDFTKHRSFQLRAMAVHPEYRGMKVASQLIQAVINQVKEKSTVKTVWLNSRVLANPLYLKNGFEPIGTPFEIKPIGLHQRFIKQLHHEI
jgi:[ribosomal protein S5]-alanine N-acetyltransferase